MPLKNVDAYINLSAIYTQQSNYLEDLFDLNKAIAIKPNFGPAFRDRSAVYFGLQEYDKAWADVQKAKELGQTVNSDFLQALKKASGK